MFDITTVHEADLRDDLAAFLSHSLLESSSIHHQKLTLIPVALRLRI